MMRRGQRFMAALMLSLTLVVAACAQPDSRWDQVQEESRTETVTEAATAAPIAGGEFNQFVPADSDDYDLTYTQEKQGFAEAKLKQGGEEVAMLSVSDTATNPEAVTKFAESELAIGGYPAVTVGSTQTAILVGDRLQVKVQSRADSFTADDRAAWLEQFDLAGLATLVP